jgi:hypothetical protein
MARNAPTGLAFLVLAEITTARSREILESAGVAYIDAAGNAFVRFPGILIRTTGPAAKPERGAGTSGSPRLSGKGGAIAESLLLHPERLWRIDELGSVAMSSAGLTHRVLTRLEQAGLIESLGSGPAKKRRLNRPGDLLDLWTDEEHERHRTETPAYVLARPGTRVAVVASDGLDRGSVVHAITGSAAASLVAPSVTATPVSEIRLAASVTPEQALTTAGARQVSEGYNLLFVQASDDLAVRSRQRVGGVWLASNPWIYLDLLRDPRRGREQAREFRDRVLGF